MSDDEIIEQLVNYLPQTVAPKIEVEYRVYYDDAGKVTAYTTEDQPGNYIVITRQQYSESRFDAVVKNGKLYCLNNRSISFRMEKNTVHGTRTSKYDINILVPDTEQDYNYWTNTIYDDRTD